MKKEHTILEKFMYLIIVMLAASIALLALSFLYLAIFGLLPSLYGKEEVVSQGPGQLWVLLLLQSALLFVYPCVRLARHLKQPVAGSLGLKKTSWKWIGLAAAAIIAVIPFINMTTQWNEAMHLPQWLSGLEDWLRQTQDASDEGLKELMSVNTVWGFLINLVVVAAAAAFSEEILFRGTLLPLLRDAFTPKQMRENGEQSAAAWHWAIWVMAIVFSAFHMQFFGFVPRMLLGALLGYLFYWTGSIWVPMTAHFLNNALAVCLNYACNLGWLPENFGDEVGTGSQWWMSLVSVLLVALIVRVFVKKPAGRAE